MNEHFENLLLETAIEDGNWDALEAHADGCKRCSLELVDALEIDGMLRAWSEDLRSRTVASREPYGSGTTSSNVAKGRPLHGLVSRILPPLFAAAAGILLTLTLLQPDQAQHESPLGSWLAWRGAAQDTSQRGSPAPIGIEM